MVDRFVRQRRLKEIGDDGQDLILRTCFRVAAGDECWIERDYLARAGAAMVAINADLVPEPFPHAAVFRHAAARRHAAGAWRALRQIKALLARPT
jgi:hypothetical protein